MNKLLLILSFLVTGSLMNAQFFSDPTLQQTALQLDNAKTDSDYDTVFKTFSEAKTSMILFNLDMKGIAVSRGSACQSGSIKPSHVLAEMLSEEDLKKPSLRISFSYSSTYDDIDALISGLKSV